MFLHMLMGACLKIPGTRFKLHLRPPHLVAEQGFNVKDIPPLPPNKTVIDIFGDLLGYLYESTKKYIQERQGDAIFNSVGANIDFVLSHPNGWEGKQQSEMRHAAITARLVNDMSDALSRISFITEGEAGLHFCLNNVQTTLDEYVSVNRFATVYKVYSQANDGVLVLDCGGGTVDISAYARSSNGRFREIAPAECKTGFPTFAVYDLTIIQVFCRGHASSLVEHMIISQVNLNRVQDLLYLTRIAQRSSGNQDTESQKT